MPKPSPSRLLNPSPITILKRCPTCFRRVKLGEFDKHIYNHYNYCEYGHYEAFELFDPEWPRCKTKG